MLLCPPLPYAGHNLTLVHLRKIYLPQSLPFPFALHKISYYYTARLYLSKELYILDFLTLALHKGSSSFFLLRPSDLRPLSSFISSFPFLLNIKLLYHIFISLFNNFYLIIFTIHTLYFKYILYQHHFIQEKIYINLTLIANSCPSLAILSYNSGKKDFYLKNKPLIFARSL